MYKTATELADAFSTIPKGVAFPYFVGGLHDKSKDRRTLANVCELTHADRKLTAEASNARSIRAWAWSLHTQGLALLTQRFTEGSIEYLVAKKVS